MKFEKKIKFLFLLISSIGIFQGVIAKEFPDKWMLQKLDWTNDSSKQMWLMRYFCEDEFFKPGGQIFIQIGGPQEIRSQTLRQSYFRGMARKKNALLFYIEHRFYGKSKPTIDLSIENLKYLSVRQVLADIANFITRIKAIYRRLRLGNSKVILFGSFYGGSLAAWMKSLYPDKVTGGWVSSAPLLKVIDFSEYYSEMGNLIRTLGGTNCYDKIKSGVGAIEKYLRNKTKYTKVNEVINICSDFDYSNSMDIQSLFLAILQAISIPIESGQISFICQMISSFDDDAKRMGFFMSNFSPYFRNGCLNVTYRTISGEMSDVQNFHGGRQYFYQKCSELGWFQTTANDEIFGNKLPLSYFATLCSDLFNNEYNTMCNVESSIIITDESRSEVGESIFMTHGEYDPWRVLGERNGTNVAIIPGAFHCSDLYRGSSDGNMGLKNMRKKLNKFISKLLK